MYAFCLSCPSATLQCSSVRRHCTTWMDICKGPTSQFPFRLQCLPSNKKRSQASASAYFYRQDIVGDYFPAQPTAKISSAMYEYKGALRPLLEGKSSYVKMAEMFAGKVTPPTILWACLHLALSHLLTYHCQNRATTGLLARVVLLKITITSTFSFFYIVTDSPKSHMHLSNYWHSVTGPEHGKWHQNVPPTLPPSQTLFARHATPFPFPWKKHYVMRQKTTALKTTIDTDEDNAHPCHFSMRIPNMKFMIIFRGFLGLKNEGDS